MPVVPINQGGDSLAASLVTMAFEFGAKRLRLFSTDGFPLWNNYPYLAKFVKAEPVVGVLPVDVTAVCLFDASAWRWCSE